MSTDEFLIVGAESSESIPLVISTEFQYRFLLYAGTFRKLEVIRTVRYSIIVLF